MRRAKDDGYIRWYCKSCNHRLKVKSASAGGNIIRCPFCSELTTVPVGNLEEVVESAQMEETGRPGHIQLDPEKLLSRLQGEREKGVGPGSAGSAPSLRTVPWSEDAAFAPIQELNDILPGIGRVEEETIGDLQRIYRNRKLNPSQRAEQVKEAAEMRARKLGELVTGRFKTVGREVSSMEARHRELSKAQLAELGRRRRVMESLQFYGRYVLGADI
jgi:hypothetical protein